MARHPAIDECKPRLLPAFHSRTALKAARWRSSEIIYRHEIKPVDAIARKRLDQKVRTDVRMGEIRFHPHCGSYWDFCPSIGPVSVRFPHLTSTPKASPAGPTIRHPRRAEGATNFASDLPGEQLKKACTQHSRTRRPMTIYAAHSSGLNLKYNWQITPTQCSCRAR